MTARKRKTLDEGDLLAVTEEELANDSDSDAEYVPELSSSDESASDSDSSDSGLSVQGFSKKDRCPNTPLFTGIPSVQFMVQNTADLTEYLEQYITPELIQL
jgi:hypothetical protein